MTEVTNGSMRTLPPGALNFRRKLEVEQGDTRTELASINLALASACLMAKVDETKRKKPIFQDWEAVRIWTEMQEKSELTFAKQVYDRYNWRSQTAIAIRSQIIDEVVKEHLLSHPYPVVIELGCGFSTRSLRFNAHREYLWYDVDSPDIIDIRSRHLGKVSPSHLIGTDVTDISWVKDISDWIEEANPSSSVLFVAEGLFMYLKKDCLEKISNCLADAFPLSHLIFDGMSDVYSKSVRASSLPIQWLAQNSIVDFPNFRVSQRWNLLQMYPSRWRHWRLLSCIPSVREADFIVKGELVPIRLKSVTNPLAN